MKNKVIIGGLVLSILAMSACSNVPGKTENAEGPNVEESIAPEIMEDIHGDTAVDALLDKAENGSAEAGADKNAADSANENNGENDSNGSTNDATSNDMIGGGKDNSSDANMAGDSSENSTFDNSDSTQNDTNGSTDSGNTNDTNSDENIETSPMFLWDYEGYIDEAKGYTWYNEFVNCDYDKDGATDRVYRIYDADAQEAYYSIEFGNGRVLSVPKAYDTGFPHIQMADLDGDGEGEVLFTLTYDTSTDPFAFGDMWLFDYDAEYDIYDEVELPLSTSENGGKALTFEYGAPENGNIKFKVQQTGLEATAEADNEYVEYWWTNEAITEDRYIWEATIKETDKGNVIYCEAQVLPRFGTFVIFNLRYDNGKYVIEDMEYSFYSNSDRG